jgi:hypothetical protein
VADRHAWVVEESEEDENFRPFSLGVFSAHVEGPGVPDHHDRGPQFVEIDVALAWARAHSPRVIVRYDAPEGEPHEFTAGTDEMQHLPRWPPAALALERRPMPGWEHLDRTEGARPISWDVEVAVLGSEADAHATVERLAQDRRVRDVEIARPAEDDEEPRLLLRLDASTVDIAEETACTVVTEALASGDVTVEAAAYPTGSDLARWNVGL